MRSSSASMRKLHRALLVVLLLAVPALSTAQDTPTENTPQSLTALLTAYTKLGGLEAQYVEEKHMGLLAKPLTSEGRIYFARPGLLLRKVEKPFASTIVITPKQVRMTDSSGTQAIDLASRPDVRPFVETMVWLLSGDAESIKSTYDVTFKREQGSAWLLQMVPKQAPLTQIIERMEIHGEGLSVREIEVHETSGDHSVTRIVNANPKRIFSPAERKKLFGTSN